MKNIMNNINGLLLGFSLIAVFSGLVGFTEGDMCEYKSTEKLETASGVIEDVIHGRKGGSDAIVLKSKEQGLYRYYIYDHNMSKVAFKLI